MTSKMKKRFTGLLSRTKSGQSISSNAPDGAVDTTADTPEDNAPRAIRLFCESGSTSNGGEEVLHLPVIVEAAESSPNAAAAAATQIRKFLSREWSQKPHVQYNAIMLLRILSDNPGATFTRNFDKGFVGTVKEVVRNCKDQSTQQIIRETLDALEVNKQSQDGVENMMQMWRKEKGRQASLNQQQGRGNNYAVNGNFGAPNGNMYNAPRGQTHMYAESYQPPRQNQLPPPVELASRVEEARNTAKILLQLIQSTPPQELLQNELVREFSERCQSAQRSMQGYINCDNPPPDDATMLTLIEANEQLSLSATRHQRAVLAARRAAGANPSPNAEMTNGSRNPAQPPAQERPFGLGVTTPPPQQTNEYGPFGNGGVVHQAPDAPSPVMLSSFAPETRNQHDSPSHFDSANQRKSNIPPESQEVSNPFLDPVEHDDQAAPLAMDYKSASPHQKQHSAAFSIEAEPSTMPAMHQRRNTADLNDLYSSGGITMTPVSAPSPTTIKRSGPPSDGFVSPQSSPRPGLGPWHNSAVTQSYVGRQESAANGLTMRGAASNPAVSEIDGQSEIGRTDFEERSNTLATDGSDSGSFSPMEVHQALQARRVNAEAGRVRDSSSRGGS